MSTTRPPLTGREPGVRRSVGRPPVPLDRIVATALRILDEEGVDALSMRMLAQRLESGTATLYRHFANRGEVIAHVIDHIFGEVEFSAEELRSLGWELACKTFALAMFDVLRRHRNIAPLLAEQAPVGPNASAQRERVLAVLLDTGFDPQLAVRSYATLARYVLGFVIQLGGDDGPGDVDGAKFAAGVGGLDPALFPASITVADHVPVPLEDEFAFGLELIVSGLAQLRRRGRGARCSQSKITELKCENSGQ